MDLTFRYSVMSLLMALLAGCGLEHELDLSKVSSLSYAYDGGKTLARPLLLTADTKEFTSLIDWLEQNRSGWEPLQATLLPVGLSIYGDGFALRIVRETAILKYRDQSGEYRQLQKSVPSEKFAFLTKP